MKTDQTPIDESIRVRIDALVARAMQAQRAPGAAIAVTRDGAVTYARGYGVMNVETETPVTPETLFHCASVTKLFVGTAVLQLAAAGRIDLDEPVIAYLPYFRLDDPSYRDMTVAQMLSHTSGMPDTDDFGWEHPEYDDGALERYVRSLVTMKPVGPPGGQCAYSNIAYEVLGDLIAKVSGIPFEEYVRRELLTPLGMRCSTLLVRESDLNLLASPHVTTESGEVVVSPIFPYNRAHAPSSTLYSNVLELSRWAMAHLNRGMLDGVRILPTEAYDFAWRPVSETGDQYWPQIGLTWFLGERSGYRCVAHEGADVGFKACLILVPEERVSVVGLSNLDRMKNEDLVDAILDVVLTSGRSA